MLVANNTPYFLTVWKSFNQAKKTQLKHQFCEVAGKNGERLSDMTFFRKKQASDWSELEKNWWAETLQIPKEKLFPIEK